MTTSSTSAQAREKPTGRGYVWLSFALGLLAPALLITQIQAKRLFVPWYLPIIGTFALVLMLVAVVRLRTIWRFLGMGLLGLLAGFEWFMISASKLPEYAGPISVGQPFPAFESSLPDGTPFTQADLRGEQNTVMVFFRGRW